MLKLLLLLGNLIFHSVLHSFTCCRLLLFICFYKGLWQIMGAVRNQVYAAFCAHLGALSFGYMIGYSSPALPQMMAVERIVQDNDAASWFGSVVTLGAIVGCLIAGWLVEHRGRRVSLIFTSLPFFVGWFLIYETQTIWLLCGGRLLTGIGSGMVLVAAPLYVAEVSSKDYRGMLGSGIQLSVTLGIFMVYALGLVLDWRNLALVAAVVPIVAIFVTLRAPESPRFLLDVGRRSEAVSTLTWLRGSSASAEEECRDMEETQSALAGRATLTEILKRPEMSRPLMLAVIIMIFQQLSGINVVVFYSSSIFEVRE
jgi:MFS transporter, SP family, solute carrier family 2 (facilitated glucose transporter), member 8